VARCNRNSAKIERLVVDRAKRDPVLDNVRTTGLVPFEMRCLDSNVRISKLNVKSTHGTAVFICVDNGSPKLRVPLPNCQKFTPAVYPN
jgi:hypothetical protein